MENKNGLIEYIKLLYIKVDTDGATTPMNTSRVSKGLKEKVNYYMGVPLEKLENVKNLGQLINTTKIYSQKSDSDKILEEELLKYIELQK